MSLPYFKKKKKKEKIHLACSCHGIHVDVLEMSVWPIKWTSLILIKIVVIKWLFECFSYENVHFVTSNDGTDL